MAMLNMVQALNLALDQEMTRDPSVLILGEDVGVVGGVFRVTEGLLAKHGEGRVIDTPLAEAGIVGVALGMAIAGLKPVAEIQFAGFAYIAFAQIEGNVSRYRSRTQGQLSAPMVVRFPYGGGVRALEHHSESREAYFAHTPGLKVVVPSGPRNARALLSSAIRDPDPVIFMEPTRSYRAFREEVPAEPETLPIGKALVVTEGKDLTLISYGAMMRPVTRALELVERDRKASIELIDLLTLSPMDVGTLVASVQKTGRAVVVQEAPRSFGVASEIIAHINDQALFQLEAPVRRVAGYDVVTPYFAREELYLPSPDRIARAIQDTLDV